MRYNDGNCEKEGVIWQTITNTTTLICTPTALITATVTSTKINRLARAMGHLEKVKRMVEAGYDCSEVLVQLAAVRSALDNTGKVILKDHMRHCMVDAVAAGDEHAIDDLCSAIDKFMK